MTRPVRKKGRGIQLIANLAMLPSHPNYLSMESGQWIDIADVSDSVLREIGKQWTDALVEKAAKRRITQGRKP